MIEPLTLVRSARLEEDLVPALRKFDSDFRVIPAGDPKTIKYALWKDGNSAPYWMMLFQNQRQFPPGIHNTLLTLTSLCDATNQQVYRQFNEITELGFGEPDNPVNERYVQETYAKTRLFFKLVMQIGTGIKTFPRI